MAAGAREGPMSAKRMISLMVLGMLGAFTSGCDVSDADLAHAVARVSAKDARERFDSGQDASQDVGTDVASVQNCSRSCPAGFRCIPAGTFDMGSESVESVSHERPVHEVVISRDFCMMDAEVTQAEWKEAYSTNPTKFPACAECPVDAVNWWEALHYANWLSARDGLSPCYDDFINCNTVDPGNDWQCVGVTFHGVDCSGYRLPTEAEWEYAARAGSTDDRYGPVDRIACYSGVDCGGIGDYRTNVARGKWPNAWGLYDMLGNVSEWTWDWYYEDYSPGAATDPTGPSTGFGRVLRGGSCLQNALGARAPSRAWAGPGEGGPFTGFRLVRTIP